MSHGTWKACPGCGGADKWRPTDRCCEDCMKALAVGRAELEQQKIDQDAHVKLFRVTTDWPHFVHLIDVNVKRSLEEAFKTLSRVALRRSKAAVDPYDESVIQLPREGPRRTYFSSFDERALVYEGPARVGRALDHLDMAVRAALEATHEEATREGRNYLLQLAQGKITMEDLSAETIKPPRRR